MAYQTLPTPYVTVLSTLGSTIQFLTTAYLSFPFLFSAFP